MEIIINKLRNKRIDEKGRIIWDFHEVSHYIYEKGLNPILPRWEFGKVLSFVFLNRYHISLYFAFWSFVNCKFF